MFFHLVWFRRLWIESEVQLFQQVTSNAFVGDGIAFSCYDCVCFAGCSLGFGSGGCGDDAYCFALIGCSESCVGSYDVAAYIMD